MKSIRDTHVGAIGIALSGLVDPLTGYCIRSTVMDWTHVAIAEQLTERFDIPVFIENDANALALATMVFGQLGQAQSAVIATYGQGIGAGSLLSGNCIAGVMGMRERLGMPC
ncbi:ROK family protein [Vibrio sp. PP-XX7]